MLDADPRLRIGEHVRDATARARVQRVACERIDETIGMDAVCRACDCEERDDLARAAGQHSFAADDLDDCLAQLRVEHDCSEAFIGKQQERTEEMIQPAARAAQDDDSLRFESESGDKGQLEVGRILIDRMPLNTSSTSKRFRGDGVEVTDEHVDLQPKPSRMLGTAVRGDDGRKLRKLDRRWRIR